MSIRYSGHIYDATIYIQQPMTYTIVLFKAYKSNKIWLMYKTCMIVSDNEKLIKIVIKKIVAYTQQIGKKSKTANKKFSS